MNVPRLKPYPEYKDSGVEWLGKVPAHWEVLPVKKALKSKSSANAPVKNTASPLPKESYVPAFSASGQDVWLEAPAYEGDALILSAVGAQCGKTFRARDKWAVVANTHILWPRSGQCLDYWWYVTNLPDWWLRAGAAQPYVQVRVSLDRPWAIPPIPEQQAIVRFLDWADGRIRRAVAARKRRIELLKEYKQAMIHEAVTGCIDVRTGQPYPEYKDSGVEWLGQIPVHWEVRRLKFLCRGIQNGATPSTTEQHYYHNGTVPWFGPSSISAASDLGTPVRYLAKHAFDDGKARLISGPAILVIVIGATAGRMGLLLGKGATNQQITAFELRPDKIAPHFALQQLRCCEPWLRSTASTATIPILDSGIVNRLPLVFPTIREQERILSALENEILPLNTTIDRTRREISLLRELHTRLIADVVTGKLDVREAAARLPEEPVEPEPPGMIGIDEEASDELEEGFQEASA